MNNYSYTHIYQIKKDSGDLGTIEETNKLCEDNNPITDCYNHKSILNYTNRSINDLNLPLITVDKNKNYFNINYNNVINSFQETWKGDNINNCLNWSKNKSGIFPFNKKISNDHYNVKYIVDYRDDIKYYGTDFQNNINRCELQKNMLCSCIINKEKLIFDNIIYKYQNPYNNEIQTGSVFDFSLSNIVIKPTNILNNDFNFYSDNMDIQFKLNENTGEINGIFTENFENKKIKIIAFNKNYGIEQSVELTINYIRRITKGTPLIYRYVDPMNGSVKNSNVFNFDLKKIQLKPINVLNINYNSFVFNQDYEGFIFDKTTGNIIGNFNNTFNDIQIKVSIFDTQLFVEQDVILSISYSPKIRNSLDYYMYKNDIDGWIKGNVSVGYFKKLRFEKILSNPYNKPIIYTFDGPNSYNFDSNTGNFITDFSTYGTNSVSITASNDEYGFLAVKNMNITYAPLIANVIHVTQTAGLTYLRVKSEGKYIIDITGSDNLLQFLVSTRYVFNLDREYVIQEITSDTSNSNEYFHTIYYFFNNSSYNSFPINKKTLVFN